MILLSETSNIVRLTKSDALDDAAWMYKDYLDINGPINGTVKIWARRTELGYMGHFSVEIDLYVHARAKSITLEPLTPVKSVIE